MLIYYTLLPSCALYTVIPWNEAVRAARYYSILHRTILKMLVHRYASSSHIHSANARVVSDVSRTGTAFYIFTGNEYYG
jgi:hypothetical protein